MTDCCAAGAKPIETPTDVCPSCDTRGLSVEFRTVKAILTESALKRVQAVSHRLCRSSSCPVVYFDETGGTYDRADVRVRIWQKEPVGERTMCYCFGETEGTIRQEFAQHGRSDAVQRVRAHIEANRCACDVRNPRGACCLGDLTTAVQRIAAEQLVDRSVR